MSRQRYDEGYTDALTMCIIEINKRIVELDSAELLADGDRYNRMLSLECLAANLEGRRDARLEDMGAGRYDIQQVPA